MRQVLTMIHRWYEKENQDQDHQSLNVLTVITGLREKTGNTVLANTGTLPLSTRTIFYVVLSALWKPLKNIKRNMWDREQG